jgi:hypothetical protein
MLVHGDSQKEVTHITSGQSGVCRQLCRELLVFRGIFLLLPLDHLPLMLVPCSLVLAVLIRRRRWVAADRTLPSPS